MILFSIVGFILASIIAFYIPGRVILGKGNNFSPFVLHTLSVAIGLVLFGWQGVLFGTLHIRWVTYLYIVAFLVVYIVKKYYPQKISISLKAIDKVSAGIITLGVFAQTISYITMGWTTSQGVIIAAHNDADHIWHATLINELIKRYPPHEPGISGVVLKDYHYWFNLITADLIRIFHLPLFTTQFIGMYILGSILFAFLTYIILRHFSSSTLFVRLGLFFIFFTGNAAGWYMLATSHVFDWNVSSLIVDATKFMDSPAYAYAIIVGFTGIYLLLQKKISWMQTILIALCFGSLIEFKVYVGIAYFAGFGCFALYSLFKKNIKVAVAFGIAVLLGLSIFLPGTTPGGGLAFIPFDIPRDFINQVKLGHADWQLRWVIFQDHKNTLRIIQYGLMMSGIYFVIQYGILLLGLVPFKKTIKTYNSFLLFMYPTIFVSIVMGLLFYQRVGGANIWEFFLAGVPFLELLVAANISSIIEKRKRIFQIVMLTVIILFTIPQWFISLKGYIYDEYFVPFHGISDSELETFNFLKNDTPQGSVVLVMGQHKYVAYASVVSLFAQRDLYLSGEGVRQQKTPVISHREDVLHFIRTNPDPEKIAEILKKEHVKYLYVYNGLYPGIYGDSMHLVQQFSNQTATIYSVN